MTHTNRWLSEEHSSLSGASLGKIISTGLLLGVVHVLTGPDHLSALAAMTTGSSWRAFALGIRWGCGHSIGLIFMALIFFAAGQTLDLDQVGRYLNYAVGFFMIVLGLWTAFHERRKYRAQLKEGVPPSLVGEIEEGQIQSSPVSQRNSSATPTNLVELMPLSQQRLSSICSDAPPHVSIVSAKECTGVETSASPSTSFQALKQEEGSLLASAQWSQAEDITEGGTVTSSSFHPRNWMCCQCVDFEKPTTQKIMALIIGIIHGFAGPGGILGVLPAVVLNDWTKSISYLASFCVASIFIMGVFAALYGEVTGRLGGNSLVVQFRIGMFSSFFSFIVGVAWVALQASGQMSAVFGE